MSGIGYEELMKKLIAKQRLTAREKFSQRPGSGNSLTALRFIRVLLLGVKYLFTRLTGAVRSLILTVLDVSRRKPPISPGKNRRNAIMGPLIMEGGGVPSNPAAPLPFSRAPKRCVVCGRICKPVTAHILYGAVIVSKYVSNCHWAGFTVMGKEIPELFHLTWSKN